MGVLSHSRKHMRSAFVQAGVVRRELRDRRIQHVLVFLEIQQLLHISRYHTRWGIFPSCRGIRPGLDVGDAGASSKYMGTIFLKEKEFSKENVFSQRKESIDEKLANKIMTNPEPFTREEFRCECVPSRLREESVDESRAFQHVCISQGATRFPNYYVALLQGDVAICISIYASEISYRRVKMFDKIGI